MNLRAGGIVHATGLIKMWATILSTKYLRGHFLLTLSHVIPPIDCGENRLEGIYKPSRLGHHKRVVSHGQG